MIIVVGAGAAGLMAAIHAGRQGAKVLVLEGSEDGGRKILISGGGRCNVLPSVPSPERFVTSSSRRRLVSILESWPLERQRAFFEDDLRLPLALEPATGKLFPVANRARLVRDALINAARQANVDFRFRTRMTSLEAKSGQWLVATDQGGRPFEAAAVILASGGLSVPATGSDGLGLEIARKLGHVVNETYPALTPLTAEPAVHATLAGVSVSVTIRARSSEMRAESSGGLLFTHQGYSGPAVLDISHVAVWSSRHRGERATISVCWGASREEWEHRLAVGGAQRLISILRSELPNRLADYLLTELSIPIDQHLAHLRRTDRLRVLEALTAYALPWTGDQGYKKAEVTGGGVALEEVHPATLESRRCPRLYLTGELLDAFGPIGGHNFSWAWATGRMAGLAAAHSMSRARSEH